MQYANTKFNYHSTVQPQLTITRGSGSSSLTEEDSLALTCLASDYYPRTSITWFKNTNSLSRTSRIEITELSSLNLASGLYTTQSDLRIASTLTTDSGAYYCKAILQVDGLDQLVTVRVDGNISIQVQGMMTFLCCYRLLYTLLCSIHCSS